MIRRCWPLLGLQLACDDTIFGGSHEVTGAGWSAVEEIFAAECNACHGPGTAATFGNLDLETDPWAIWWEYLPRNHPMGLHCWSIGQPSGQRLVGQS